MNIDTVSDMLTRIRNASMRGHDELEMPYTKFNEGIAQVLKKEGYISEVKSFKYKDSKIKGLSISLKYDDKGDPLFKKIERISKPGLRKYSRYSDFESVMSGLGMYIVSTPRGVMSSKEARNKKLGGELVCKIF